MKEVITSLIILLLMVTHGYADALRTVAIYKQHMQSSDHNTGNFDHHLHHMLYLSGVADAYTITNRRATAAERSPLYCQPDGALLNGNDYIRILEQGLYHPENPLPDQLTVAEALLLTLQEEFPCN